MKLRETLQKLGLEDRAKGELPSVERLLEEMPLHQDPQGFFAYWPGSGSGDIALNAQAVEFMDAAQKAGIASIRRCSNVRPMP